MTVGTNDFANPGDVVDAKTGELISTAKQRGEEDRYGVPALLREHGGDGRPYIQPADGSPARWYQRVTTLAKSLEKSEGLTNWKLKRVAQGLAGRRDLIQLVQSDPADEKKVLEVANQALEAAQASAPANSGTAIHRMTEFIDMNQWPVGLDADTERTLEAYSEAVARYNATMVGAEIFTANDELGVAGTFDRMMMLPSVSDKPLIGDIKTGRWDAMYPHYLAIQMACYSRSQIYKPTSHTTGERGLDLREVVDQDWAIMMHMPQVGPEALTCTFYKVDIAAGWEAALIARDVREWLKRKDIIERL